MQDHNARLQRYHWTRIKICKIQSFFLLKKCLFLWVSPSLLINKKFASHFRRECTDENKSWKKIKDWYASRENRICIRVEFTRKKCKTAILLYCFHTAGVLHIFVLYKLLGPGTSFYRKSKINIKRKPNYEIGWFHNWPMIISLRLYAFHFTIDVFPL